MAIQPVDLQLAYLAAPASAAAANVVQQAPEVAAQAAQAAFVSHVQQREETIEETTRAEGTKIRPDPEGGGNAGTYQPRKRRRQFVTGAADENAVETVAPDEESHFIDTTA